MHLPQQRAARIVLMASSFSHLANGAIVARFCQANVLDLARPVRASITKIPNVNSIQIGGSGTATKSKRTLSKPGWKLLDMSLEGCGSVEDNWMSKPSPMPVPAPTEKERPVLLTLLLADTLANERGARSFRFVLGATHSRQNVEGGRPFLLRIA